jgi:hypothetical protein
LLCSVPEKPPPNVPPISGSVNANTTRERYEQLHAVGGACYACHSSFEPFGFALEHFDEAGRFRDNENGFPINAAASGTIGGAITAFDGVTDLATKLASTPEVTDCVSGLLAAYVFAGGGGQICLAEEQRNALLNGSYGLQEYYIQLAAAPSFTRRVR